LEIQMNVRQRLASYAAAVVGAFALAVAPWAAPAPATAQSNPLPPVDVAVKLSASDTTLNPGQPVTLTILVENKLPGTAKPVRIKLFRHRDFEDTRVVSAPGFSCAVLPLEIDCRGGQVDHNRDVPIVVTAKAPRRPGVYVANALHDNSSGKLNDVDPTNHVSRVRLTVPD
jgi:hypothetical protein